MSLEDIRVTLKEDKKNLRRSYAEDLHVYLESLIKLAQEAMELSLFMHLNLQASRVIIKRYETRITKYQKRPRDLIRNKLHNINKKVKDMLSGKVLERILDDLENSHYIKCRQAIEQRDPDSLLRPNLDDKLEILALAIGDFKDHLYKRNH